MPDIIRGHSFVSGEVVEAQSLNDLVSNAVVQPTLISQKVLKDPAALSDRILIEDSGALKGITIQQIVDLVTPHIVNAAVPIGTVADFAGGNAPIGWFLCQGQDVDRDVYSDLFAIIGTIYGAGDGTTTFTLPDCRGRVVAGVDNVGRVGDPTLNAGLSGGTLGSVGGLHYSSLTVEQMPAHAHAAYTSSLLPMRTVAQEGGGSYGLTATSAFAGRVMIQGSYGDQNGQSTTTIYAAGGSQLQNNVQPTIMLQKIIKALNA